MVDLFEEVEDQLRTEQYKQLAFKLLPWLLGLIVVVVVATGIFWGVTAYRDANSAKAAETYGAGVALLSKDDNPGAFAKFGEVAKSGPAAYRSLALQVQGAIRLEDGKTKEAVALFDQAAQVGPKGKAGYIVTDAARLKSAFALLDDAPYADIEGRLKPLTDQDRPYRATAREALAMARLKAGKIKEAREDFVILTTALYASEGVIKRANAAIELIDSGGAAGIAALVKAPPPAVLTVPQAQGAAQ